MAQYPMQIRPFDIPVSVTVEMPAGRKQDGPRALPVIAITDLPRETLQELCDEFTSRLMALHAKSASYDPDLQGDEYTRR